MLALYHRQVAEEPAVPYLHVNIRPREPIATDAVLSHVWKGMSL
jgi:hypothetical protein